jgi:hypothetical protein
MNTSRLPAVALAACVLGVTTCPFLYFVSGAPFDIIDVAERTAIIGSAFIAVGFLLWRFLAKPSERHAAPWLKLVEAGCWAALLNFVIVVSDMRLMSDRERIGSTCLFFFGMSVLWLPLTVLRKTALEQRLDALPRSVSVGVLFLVLAASGVMVYFLFALPPDFL